MTTADLFNAPTEMEYGGKTYRLRQPLLLEEGMFQRWLEQRARDAVGRAVELDDDRRRKLDQDVNDAIAAGEYEWGGPICVRALRTPTGMAKIVAIVCRDQGMTDQIARQLIDRKTREIAAILSSKVNPDPNSVRATLATLGLPADFLSSSSPTPPSTDPPPNSPDSRATN